MAHLGTVSANPPLPDRVDKLMDLLPKHQFKMKPAAIEAGYSEQYARTQQKALWSTIAKRQQIRLAEQMGKAVQQPGSTALKEGVIESLGLTKDTIRKTYKGILFQS